MPPLITKNDSFVFRDIPVSHESLLTINLLELATNIITDWMPRTPNSMALGFANLLSEILETITLNGNQIWSINSDMAGFEKQWKQVSSWILGVGFCKKIIEIKGYPWWAPVSAFLPNRRINTTLTPGWSNQFNRSCTVIRPNPPLSRLFPDYVIARINSHSNNNEISLAESKGCGLYLEGLGSAPNSWANQAKNADFLYNSTSQPITQNLVIATRVNPNAKQGKTRKVYVRAWNSSETQPSINLATILEVIELHYIGVCERIGLQLITQLIILKNNIRKESMAIDDKEYIEKLNRQIKNNEETSWESIEGLEGEQVIFLNKSKKTFYIGKTNIQIGLSITAFNFIKELPSSDNNKFLEKYESFKARIQQLKKSIKESSNISIRLDGTVSRVLER